MLIFEVGNADIQAHFMALNRNGTQLPRLKFCDHGFPDDKGDTVPPLDQLFDEFGIAGLHQDVGYDVVLAE